MRPALLLLTIGLLVVSLVDPLYPREQPLQHSPTVFALVLLALETRWPLWSRFSFACLVIFLWLHILGARHIYSYVPYDRWLDALCGQTLSDWCGWRRNHYDRLVHFSFGLLWLLPLAEAAQKFGSLRRGWALGFGCLGVLAAGALYEILEWLLAVWMAPTHAEAYNGQQGDPWDAQKDMALAGLGAAAMGLVCLATGFGCRAPAKALPAATGVPRAS